MLKNGWFISCEVCGKKRYVTPGVVKQGRGRFCSKSCSSKNAVQGMLKVRGQSWRNNIRRAVLERFKDPSKHPSWKGNKVGYFGLHDWIEKVGGKPKKCEVCGTDKKRVYHWANKSGGYKRERSDWMRVCVPCHRKYDYARKRNGDNRTPTYRATA